MLEDGVADHVLDAVGVNDATPDADPVIVDVLEVEIDRVPVEEIVEDRVVLIVLEGEDDAVEERVGRTDTEEDIV